MNNDCKVIRCRIEESILGQELDASLMDHVRKCTSCHEFYERDIKLRQLMAGLVPVEAPADFDFRLRTRIAKENLRPQNLFPFANLSLALPSAGLAAVILLAVGVLIFRNGGNPPPNTKSAVEQQPITPNRTPANTSDTTVESVGENAKPKVAWEQRKPVVAEKRQLASLRERNKVVFQDSSSYGAQSLRREDAIDEIPAPLTFPVHTLKVSVDDGSGVARTISIPTVSFGSQRTLAGAGSWFQPPARGDW